LPWDLPRLPPLRREGLEKEEDEKSDDENEAELWVSMALKAAGYWWNDRVVLFIHLV